MFALIGKLKILKICWNVAKNPYDTEEIGRLTELSTRKAGAKIIEPMMNHLKTDAASKLALENQTPVKPFTLETISKCAPGTFGHAYYNFLTKNNLNIDLIPVEPNSPINYIRYRYRKYHDMWHILFDYDTSLPGELDIQVITYAQLRSLMPIVIVMLVLIHGLIFDRKLLPAMFDAFANSWNQSKKAPMIWGLPLEDYFDEDLQAVRTKVLGAAAPKQVPSSKAEAPYEAGPILN